MTDAKAGSPACWRSPRAHQRLIGWLHEPPAPSAACAIANASTRVCCSGLIAAFRACGMTAVSIGMGARRARVVLVMAGLIKRGLNASGHALHAEREPDRSNGTGEDSGWCEGRRFQVRPRTEVVVPADRPLHPHRRASQERGSWQQVAPAPAQLARMRRPTRAWQRNRLHWGTPPSVNQLDVRSLTRHRHRCGVSPGPSPEWSARFRYWRCAPGRAGQTTG